MERAEQSKRNTSKVPSPILLEGGGYGATGVLVVCESGDADLEQPAERDGV